MEKVTAQQVLAEIKATANAELKEQALSILGGAIEDGYEDAVLLSGGDLDPPAGSLSFRNEIVLVRGGVETKGNVIAADGVENNFAVIVGDVSCTNLELPTCSTVFVFGDVHVHELLVLHADASLFVSGKCEAKYFMRDDATYEALRDVATSYPEEFPNPALWERCEAVNVAEIVRPELMENDEEIDLGALRRTFAEGKSALATS